MPHFKKTLPVKEVGNLDFYFNRIYTVSGLRYHVSVMDRSSKSFHFTMEAQGAKWKIIPVPEPPDWILNLEERLADAVMHHLMNA